MGALGPVFRTYEPTRDRLVAVKVFRLDITPEQAQALAGELAHAAEAELFHPSVVEPIAAGIQGPVAYRAEEYVAAESLDVAMRHYAPASFDTMMRIIGQLAEAIDMARAAGVGHGALHPRDVFVTPEEARASGFGIVDALERVGLRAPVRRPYSAPERIDGADWSTPADVFSLGAMAFELLTGRRPSGTGAEIGPLTGAVIANAEALQAVLARAMDESPAARFPTGLALANALVSAAAAPTGPVPARTAAPSQGPPPLLAVPPPIPDLPSLSADAAAGFPDEVPSFAPAAAASTSPIEMIPIPLEAPVFADEEGHVALDDEPPPFAPEVTAAAAVATERADDVVVEREEEIAAVRETDIADWSLTREEAEVADAAAAHDIDLDALDVGDATGTEAEAFSPYGDPEVEAAADALVFDAADLALTDHRPTAGFGDEFRRVPHESDPVEFHVEPEVEREPIVEPALTEPAEEPTAEPAPALLAPALFDRPDSPPQIVERAVRPQRGFDAEDPPPYQESVPASSESNRRGMLPLAAVLIVGILIGLGVGYLALSRGQSSATVASGGASTPAPTPARPEVNPPAAAAPTTVDAPPAAPSSRPAASPAAPARSGRLVVRSTPPGAAVTINGKWSGRTPLTREGLPFGDYAIRVLLPGYQTRHEQVSLSGDAASRTLAVPLQREPAAAGGRATAAPVPANPAPRPAPPPVAEASGAKPAAPAAAAGATTGGLEIDSRPVGAQVFVDDRPVGATPVRLPEVAPGNHNVRLELPDHRTWTQVAQVTRGKTTRVAGSLEPIR